MRQLGRLSVTASQGATFFFFFFSVFFSVFFLLVLLVLLLVPLSLSLIPYASYGTTEERINRLDLFFVLHFSSFYFFIGLKFTPTVKHTHTNRLTDRSSSNRVKPDLNYHWPNALWRVFSVFFVVRNDAAHLLRLPSSPYQDANFF